MRGVEQVDVLIVGAGPAGMSTALHLVQRDPRWAARMAVVDKAVHPREKLCGGGVTNLGVGVLNRLGLSFTPAHVPVQEVRLIYGERVFAVRDNPVFRITRRDQFDHWLVECGQRQGITVRQNEAVQAVAMRDHHVEVTTERAVIQAKVVVAADGATSFMRQQLKWGGSGRTARLLEVLTPEVAEDRFEFRDRVAVFDFTPMATGLQGYYWDFPSFIGGQPFMNRGVYDSRIRAELPRVPLKQTLSAALSRRDRTLADYELKSHPIHWFDASGEFARRRVLLVGDAAGVDPWVGEGISFALAYGEAAATEINEAFRQQDFDFARYRARILTHPILKQLRGRAQAARIFYSLTPYPWLAGLLWGISPWLFRLLTWYKPEFIPVQKPRLLRLPT